MGIIANHNTVALVQGITGKQGSLHTKLMLKYGTRIAAGVTPNKREKEVHGVPVYSTIEEALRRHSPTVSLVFVPAPSAKDAAKEALDGGIRTVIMVTEHVPIKDTIELTTRAKKAKATIIGPNTPGIITPGECKLGIMPHQVFEPGRIGIVSRSGTLTYEVAACLTKKHIGQSSCVGIGGDPVTGLNFVETLGLFKTDPQTEVIVLIGEIGGNLEEETAKYIARTRYPKPIVAYIAGLSAPPEKRMGHAGAMVMGKAGTAQTKIDAFEHAGVRVAARPSEIIDLLHLTLRR
jgi:succinyl-CoA synthetase alpha subunit